MCGRITAYQDNGPDAFFVYDSGQVNSINQPYADGVLLTHGRPRQHIWAFVAGLSEFHRTTEPIVCPCDAAPSNHISVPPFLDGEYFCESGYNSGSNTRFFPNDPLWDGDGCTTSSTCCSLNNPPYFTKQLPSRTIDDIEARLCHVNGPGTPIELIELYVQ